jgi:hypothetical protein
MTAALIYCVLALLIIVGVVFLIRSWRADVIPDAEVGTTEAGSLWEGPDLALAERIFDRTDYLWLRDEVGFPTLAESLLRSRRQIALNWLRAVRKSFDELIRTPGPVPGAHDPTSAPESWDLLRLLLRFHLVLGYAIVVVRLFGPYHRLVPSLGWMPPLFEPTAAREPYNSTNVPRSS